MEIMTDPYYRHAAQKMISVDSVITIHYFKYSRDFNVPGESHDFYELVFADSGEVEILNGHDKYTLRQGEAFIHKPGIFHNIRANNVFSNIIIITFETASVADFDIFDKVLTLSEDEKALLSDIVREAAETFIEPLDIIELTKMNLRESIPFAALQMLIALIEKLLILLCRKNILQPPDKKNSAYRAYAAGRIEDYLRANIYEKLSLAQISAELNYSIPYLKAVFRVEKGMSIMQHHTELKIETAKRLIAEKSASLTEIAQILAFASLQHFSSVFKAHTNMSPSQYAKSVKINKLI